MADKTPGSFPSKSTRDVFLGVLPGLFLVRKGWLEKEASPLFGGGDDDSSQPNIGGFAERSTTDKSAVRMWEQGRTGGPADDALRRGLMQ